MSFLRKRCIFSVLTMILRMSGAAAAVLGQDDLVIAFLIIIDRTGDDDVPPEGWAADRAIEVLKPGIATRPAPYKLGKYLIMWKCHPLRFYWGRSLKYPPQYIAV